MFLGVIESLVISYAVMLKTTSVSFFASGCCTTTVPSSNRKSEQVLGGSWDLVSKVTSTLSGVISNYTYSYLIYNPTY